MFDFNEEDRKKFEQYQNNNYQANFGACVKFVQRTWPNDSEDIQILKAEAVYAITQTFFNEIIPTVVRQTLTPSLN